MPSDAFGVSPLGADADAAHADRRDPGAASDKRARDDVSSAILGASRGEHNGARWRGAAARWGRRPVAPAPTAGR